MDKRLWLKFAAGLSFFMAICQTAISIFPDAAAYFQAPPSWRTACSSFSLAREQR
jgi:hypothetical protein